MNAFKHLVRIPGPLTCEPATPVAVARRFLRYYDKQESMHDIRVVVKVDGRWYYSDREPYEVKVSEDRCAAQFAMTAQRTCLVETFGFLDHEQRCIAIEPMLSGPVCLLPLHVLNAKYEVTPF